MNRGSVVGLADQRLSDSHVEAAKALIAAGCIPVPRTRPRVLDLPFGGSTVSWDIHECGCKYEVGDVNRKRKPSEFA